MLKRLTYISILLIALSLGATASARSIKAAVDSSQITMGYQTAIRFDIVDQAGSPSEILVDKDAIPAEVELIDWVYGDTADLGNGLVEMKRALIIQSFDSGLYTIPPFLMVAGPDTLRTEPITLKVNPVDVSHMDDINPIAPAMDFESRWYDFLPDWLTDYWQWILAGLLLVAAVICGYLIMTRKVEVPLIPKKKPVPPYQLAMQRLESLREQNLWQSGQEKEYYTRLIDILRDYLQGRFGINAMEMTSQQITRVLNESVPAEPGAESSPSSPAGSSTGFVSSTKRTASARARWLSSGSGLTLANFTKSAISSMRFIRALGMRVVSFSLSTRVICWDVISMAFMPKRP